MAKKKKVTQKPVSPQRYIREYARKLPVAECWATKNLIRDGGGVVAVGRRRKSGNYVLGIYILDTFCRGVLRTFMECNAPEAMYRGLISKDTNDQEMGPISYAEAHNLVYGVVAFAKEAGIEAHPSFELAQYILEEDTDDVPLIEYEFGKGGQHYLVAFSKLEANSLVPVMKKNLGDNFSYIIDEYDELEEGNGQEVAAREPPTTTELLTVLEELKSATKQVQAMSYTPYLYTPPAYPTELNVHNTLLIRRFYGGNESLPSDESIREILELPRESLIHDLEQMALYEIGCFSMETPDNSDEVLAPDLFIHVSFFLAELRAEDSLKVILETMRQRSEFYDYYFRKLSNKILIPTLYLLGRNRLPELMDYMKEPGLYTFIRPFVPGAVEFIARMQPERRGEVIEWFRELLIFYTHHLAETIYCDGALAGMLIIDLIKLQAVELLPEIKALYDTGLVDTGSCGNFEKVKTQLSGGVPLSSDNFSLDIFERYGELRRLWE